LDILDLMRRFLWARQALLVNDFRGKVDGRVIVIQMRFECLPYRLGINDSNVIGIICNQQFGQRVSFAKPGGFGN
jgi:hypothetical protein